ncbi:hypothetical protein Cadr_000015209 [Camelus dromedarius]|uniref:Uncharacterized protein n=1 Tax=Camelus dromedarius TaxID=9838 RepID=A0A5N4DNG0_CAMDR|nr:hypothetical protein Cadr_000015209 [Camelus dromedarius]
MVLGASLEEKGDRGGGEEGEWSHLGTPDVLLNLSPAHSICPTLKGRGLAHSLVGKKPSFPGTSPADPRSTFLTVDSLTGYCDHHHADFQGCCPSLLSFPDGDLAFQFPEQPLPGLGAPFLGPHSSPAFQALDHTSSPGDLHQEEPEMRRLTAFPQALQGSGTCHQGHQSIRERAGWILEPVGEKEGVAKASTQPSLTLRVTGLALYLVLTLRGQGSPRRWVDVASAPEAPLLMDHEEAWVVHPGAASMAEQLEVSGHFSFNGILVPSTAPGMQPSQSSRGDMAHPKPIKHLAQNLGHRGGKLRACKGPSCPKVGQGFRLEEGWGTPGTCQHHLSLTLHCPRQWPPRDLSKQMLKAIGASIWGGKPLGLSDIAAVIGPPSQPGAAIPITQLSINPSSVLGSWLSPGGHERRDPAAALWKCRLSQVRPRSEQGHITMLSLPSFRQALSLVCADPPRQPRPSPLVHCTHLAFPCALPSIWKALLRAPMRKLHGGRAVSGLITVVGPEETGTGKPLGPLQLLGCNLGLLESRRTLGDWGLGKAKVPLTPGSLLDPETPSSTEALGSSAPAGLAAQRSCGRGGLTDWSQWVGLNFVGEADFPESSLPGHPPQALQRGWGWGQGLDQNQLANRAHRQGEPWWKEIAPVTSQLVRSTLQNAAVPNPQIPLTSLDISTSSHTISLLCPKGSSASLPWIFSCLNLSEGTSSQLTTQARILRITEPPLTPSLPSSNPALSPGHPAVISRELPTSHRPSQYLGLILEALHDLDPANFTSSSCTAPLALVQGDPSIWNALSFLTLRFFHLQPPGDKALCAHAHSLSLADLRSWEPGGPGHRDPGRRSKDCKLGREENHSFLCGPCLHFPSLLPRVGMEVVGVETAGATQTPDSPKEPGSPATEQPFPSTLSILHLSPLSLPASMLASGRVPEKSPLSCTLHAGRHHHLGLTFISYFRYWAPLLFYPALVPQGTGPSQTPGSPGSSPNTSVTSCVALAKTSVPLPFAFCSPGAELEGLQDLELSDLCDFQGGSLGSRDGGQGLGLAWPTPQLTPIDPNTEWLGIDPDSPKISPNRDREGALTQVSGFSGPKGLSPNFSQGRRRQSELWQHPLPVAWVYQLATGVGWRHQGQAQSQPLPLRNSSSHYFPQSLSQQPLLLAAAAAAESRRPGCPSSVPQVFPTLTPAEPGTGTAELCVCACVCQGTYLGACELGSTCAIASSKNEVRWESVHKDKSVYRRQVEVGLKRHRHESDQPGLEASLAHSRCPAQVSWPFFPATPSCQLIGLKGDILRSASDKQGHGQQGGRETDIQTELRAWTTPLALAETGKAARLETPPQLRRSPLRKANTLSLDSALSYARHISPPGPLQTVPTRGQVSSGLGRTSVRSGLCKLLVTHFLFLHPCPNLAPRAVVSLMLPSPEWLPAWAASNNLLPAGLCKKWEVALVGISLSWYPEWRGTQMNPLDPSEAGAGEWSLGHTADESWLKGPPALLMEELPHEAVKDSKGRKTGLGRDQENRFLCGVPFLGNRVRTLFSYTGPAPTGHSNPIPTSPTRLGASQERGRSADPRYIRHRPDLCTQTAGVADNSSNTSIGRDGGLSKPGSALIQAWDDVGGGLRGETLSWTLKDEGLVEEEADIAGKSSWDMSHIGRSGSPRRGLFCRKWPQDWGLQWESGICF